MKGVEGEGVFSLLQRSLDVDRGSCNRLAAERSSLGIGTQFRQAAAQPIYHIK